MKKIVLFIPIFLLAGCNDETNPKFISVEKVYSCSGTERSKVTWAGEKNERTESTVQKLYSVTFEETETKYSTANKAQFSRYSRLMKLDNGNNYYVSMAWDSSNYGQGDFGSKTYNRGEDGGQASKEWVFASGSSGREYKFFTKDSYNQKKMQLDLNFKTGIMKFTSEYEDSIKGRHFYSSNSSFEGTCKLV